MKQQRKKCLSTGKVVFKTSGEAKNRLLSLKSHNKCKFKSGSNKKPDVVRSYYCTYCRGFHLTSLDESYKRRKPTDKYINKMKFLNSIDIEKWRKDSIPFEEGHIPPPKK